MFRDVLVVNDAVLIEPVSSQFPLGRTFHETGRKLAISGLLPGELSGEHVHCLMKSQILTDATT